MFMALAAVFGAKVLGGVLSGIAGNKQAAAQNKVAYINNQRMLFQAGQQASAAYTQMGSLASQATGLQAEAHRQAQLQEGAQAVSAAASGTIGSSVDAVQNDIEHEEDERRAQLANDLDTQLTNIRSQANSAYEGATNGLDHGVKTKSMGSIVGGSIVNAGLSTAMDYLGSRMQFGASAAKGATAAATGSSLGATSQGLSQSATNAANLKGLFGGVSFR